uniref:Uncharacterized protein n=1 Tax=viral metagenome TaxID=1070528 RepID=A0A6C0KBJ6_9ZZZZ
MPLTLKKQKVLASVCTKFGTSAALQYFGQIKKALPTKAKQKQAGAYMRFIRRNRSRFGSTGVQGPEALLAFSRPYSEQFPLLADHQVLMLDTDDVVIVVASGAGADSKGKGWISKDSKDVIEAIKSAGKTGKTLDEFSEEVGIPFTDLWVANYERQKKNIEDTTAGEMVTKLNELYEYGRKNLRPLLEGNGYEDLVPLIITSDNAVKAITDGDNGLIKEGKIQGKRLVKIPQMAFIAQPTGGWMMGTAGNNTIYTDIHAMAKEYIKAYDEIRDKINAKYVKDAKYVNEHKPVFMFITEPLEGGFPDSCVITLPLEEGSRKYTYEKVNKDLAVLHKTVWKVAGVNGDSGDTNKVTLTKDGKKVTVVNWHGGSSTATEERFKEVLKNHPDANIICGDSNITLAKTEKLKPKPTAPYDMANVGGGITDNKNTIFSSVKITKNRWAIKDGKGVADVLMNNQYTKAGPNPKGGKGEIDGMFIIELKDPPKTPEVPLGRAASSPDLDSTVIPPAFGSRRPARRAAPAASGSRRPARRAASRRAL